MQWQFGNWCGIPSGLERATNLFGRLCGMLLLAENEKGISTALAVQWVHHHAQVVDLAHFLEERHKLVLVDAGRDLADVDLNFPP